MIVSVAVEDEAWLAVADIEALAARVTDAVESAEPSTAGSEVALLLTGDDEVAVLNKTWRGKPSSTNVLSFPAPRDVPRTPGEPAFLGDIVLASGIVAKEAKEQGRDLRAHTAHLLVHGLLHLVGYDHEEEAEAVRMESQESRILQGLGFPDPYAADKLL